MRLLLLSLRSRLITLVLLPIIPLIALLLYSVLEQRRLAAAQVQSTTLTYVDEITDSQEQIIDGAHQLLIGLAQLPEVRRHDARACSAVFAAVLQRFPTYANLGAAKPDGEIFCSGLPLRDAVNIGDCPYFQEILRTKDLATSSYLIGRISGRASIVIAYPSVDSSGNVRAVVYAGTDIAWLDRTIARMSLPPGSAVTLMNREGTILYRHPDPEKWVGKPARGPFIKLDQLLAGQKVATEGIGMDGVPRIFAFSMVHSMPADRAVIVRVGIPKALIFVEANRTFRRDIAIMALVILVALISAWAFSQQSLVYPIDSLVRATERLAGGDLSVRTELPHNGGELGQLARSFDSMAKALQMRQAEAKRAQEEILNLARFPEENPSPVLRVNHDGQILEVNPASSSLLQEWGCQARGFVPQFWREVVSDSLASGTRKLIDAVCREQIFSLSVVPIQDAGYVNLYGTDVTERRMAEEALRESGARFRSYFELPLIGIAITSPEKGWIEVNDQICSMMGYSREELLRMTWSELTHLDDLAAEVEQFNRILAGQVDSYSMDKRFIRKNGEVVWTSIAVGCVRDSGGRVKHIVALGLDITERKQVEESLRRLSSQLLHAQDDERRRIARELHDNLAQKMAAIAMTLDRVGLTPTKGFADVQKTLSEVRDLVNQSQKEIRTLSYLLHPPLLDEMGLLPALRSYTDGFNQRSGIKVALNAPVKIPDISPEAGLTLFRVVQEALANVHRHSGSPTANVQISKSAHQELVVEVSDQGHGMPFGVGGGDEKTGVSLGVGIVGMRERLRQLGGTLEIESSKRGTTVRATLPIGTESS